MRRFLAFDIGAESGRAMLATWRDDVISLRELVRFSNTPIDVAGTLRWDIDAIWAGVRHGLDAAAGEPLTSIGVDTWGCDYGLLDAEGQLLEAPYHYRDHRTDGVMNRVFARVSREHIYSTTGIQCLPFNTLYQLRAARERSPGVLDAAHMLLTMPDLVNHWLTGRAACEFTNATTTQCVDAATQSWAADLLDDLEIPSRIFGPIVQPGTRLGEVGTNLSHQLAGTPVVAPACHDTGSAVASVEGGGDIAFLSCGTWSLLGAEVPAPVISERSRELDFTNEGGVAGTTRLLKNIAGLWLLQACRKTWAARGQPWSYEELVAAAADELHAFRTIIDPDDPEFLHPDDMVAAIGRYCGRTGQPVPLGPPSYTRTIIESLSLKYRLVIDALEELTGTRIRTLRVIGGGAMNRLLMQCTADAIGRPVVAGPVEATALGNIAIQALTMGAAGSLAEARAAIARSFPPERYEPRTPERWHAPYARLREYMRD